MKSQTMHEAQEKVKRLSDLKDTSEYTELEQLHKTNITPIKLEDLSGHVRGRSNIMSKLRELFDHAEKEVIICTSINDFEDKSRVVLPALEKINKNDIKIRLALSGDEDRIRRFSNKHNLKVKKVNSEGRFFIVDKKETFFMINHEREDEEIGVWLRSQYFSNVFASMFETSLRK